MAEREFCTVERDGRLLIVTLNRPERYNALHFPAHFELAEVWDEFAADPELWVAIVTGAGDKAFCAGNDLRFQAEGNVRKRCPTGFAGLTDRYDLNKPVIAAVNGFAMGGGFMLVERTDLRVAVKGALFEISEAKRWLLGGFNHGFIANLSYPVAMEMAFGFRFTAERFHELGFVNRLVEPDELMPTAMEMADHLLSLPPASRVNTLYMMRQMRPTVSPAHERLAAALHEHGCLEDRMESRRAFAEKRKPKFKGWNDPADRYRMPTLESVMAGDD